MPLVAALLDVLRIPLVFLLALRLGPGLRRALAAAAVFTFIPATYVLQQWGNWPTQMSLWLTLAWLAARRPGLGAAAPARCPFALVSGLLGLALLSYTVTAAYIGLIFGRVRRAWACCSRGGTGGLSRAAPGAVVAGIALALLVFYGAYVGEFLTVSIPTLLGATADTGAGAGGSVTTRTGGVAGLPAPTRWARRSSPTAWPQCSGWGWPGSGLALSEWWTAACERRGGVRPARPAWAFGLMVAWLISLPLFTAADYVVDQALKEYWFALPAIAVLGGAWLPEAGPPGPRRGRCWLACWVWCWSGTASASGSSACSCTTGRQGSRQRSVVHCLHR